MRKVLVLLALSAGCGSLPEITFVPDSVSDASTATDTGVGVLSDGGTPTDGAGIGDAPSADVQPTVDAAPACPNPSSGVTCCQNQFCSGQCPTQGNSSKQCALDCANHGCVPTMVCCRAGNEYRGCVALGSPCP